MNFYPDLCSLLSFSEKLFEYSKYSGIKKKIMENSCSQAQRLFYSFRLIKLKQVVELTLT